MGNLVWLLNNWLVNFAEMFTDILKYYVLQMTANKVPWLKYCGFEIKGFCIIYYSVITAFLQFDWMIKSE